MITTTAVGRDRAVAALREGALPLRMGPPFILLEQDGRFRVRELVDGEPTGEIHLETVEREDLLSLLELIDWPTNW